MARRRLEAAIQAAKAIHQEPAFTTIDQQFKYRYDIDKDGIFSLQFAYDASLLAVGYGDGSIEMVDTCTGQNSCVVRTGGPRSLGIMVLRFHPKENNLIVAGASDGSVYSASCTKETPCALLVKEAGNEINCLDFNQTGNRFATAGKDLNIRIYDIETLENVTTYTGNQQSTLFAEDATAGHAQRIFALKYHPEDNNVFISAGWDNMLRIWDVRTAGGLQRMIAGPHISGDGLDIKGNQILTASWVHTDALQLWDYRKGSLVKNLAFAVKNDKKPTGAAGDVLSGGAYLYCAQFCASDAVIAAGSGTNSAQVVSLTTDEVLLEIRLNKPVYAVDSAQNGRLLAVAGAGEKMLLSVVS